MDSNRFRFLFRESDGEISAPVWRGWTVALTGVTSLMHWKLGNVDFTLVGSLLIGSIPGGLLGSYLSTRVPVLWLRRILCTVLLATGARMIWA